MTQRVQIIQIMLWYEIDLVKMKACYMLIIKSTCGAMSKTKSCNQHNKIKLRGKVLFG